MIQASADRYATNSKNMGANFGITLIGSNGVSAGLNYGQMNSKGTLYNNAQIQAGNKLIVKADDMTVRGGRLEGKYVDVDVKKNLLIESLQDSEEMKQIGTNVGYSFKKEKAQDGTVSKKGDGSLGLSFGGKDKKWVKEQSGIIGTENTKVSVGGTTKLIGSIIGGKNTTLRTGKLEYSDIYDKDKGYDIGLNSKVTVSKNEDEWNISKTIGANFGARDKEQINRATIGSGTIIVGGKVVNPNINRDESIAQEITKDISVNKISVQFVKRTPKWGLAAIQDILGGYVKNTVLVPVDYTINKFKLYEKYDIFKSGNTTYKVTIEKDEKGNIHKNKKEVSKKEKFAKGTYAFVNGMYTPLDIAVNIYLPQFELMKDDFRNDEELENLKPGEKREYVLFYNEYHTFEGDLIECLYDKFGTKGDGKKIYSNAAKQLGEKLYINRDRIEDMKLFSQGNIQWYSGMQSMEETYGEGVLNKVITSHYTSIGSPLNGDDFRKFIAAKVGNGKAKVKIKNDEREPVANFIGWNPGNVKRGTFLTNRIKNGEDKLIDIEFHSYYFLEQENTTDERYRLYQKPVNVYGKLLELYNIDTYINFFNKYKEERGKKNEKK